MTTIVLILGIISSITLVLGGLSTQRKRMLMFAIVTSILVAVQYSMTGATLALIICSIGIVRNLTALAALKHPILNTWYFLALFLTCHTTAFIATADWNNFNYLDALPLIGAYLGTTALFFKKMVITKAMMIACGGVWIVYEFHAGVYGQMVGEAFTIIANIVAFVTLLVAQRHGVAEADVDNVDTHIIDVITTSIPVIQEKARTAAIPIVNTFTSSIPVVNTLTKPIPVIQNND